MGHGALAHAGLDQGVAIGGHLERTLGANDAAGTADVLHDDRLLEDLAHFFGHQATQHIAGASWGEGHDQLDRAAGKVRLGLGGTRTQQAQKGEAGRSQPVSFVHHVLSPFGWGQVMGAGLNSTSALCNFHCSAQVLLPLAVSSSM